MCLSLGDLCVKGAEIVHSSTKQDDVCRKLCCPCMLLVVFVLSQSNDNISILFLLNRQMN